MKIISSRTVKEDALKPISASGLKDWADCPQRAFTRWIGLYKNVAFPQRIGSIVGDMAHKGLGFYFRDERATAEAMLGEVLREAEGEAPIAWDKTTPDAATAIAQAMRIMQSVYDEYPALKGLFSKNAARQELPVDFEYGGVKVSGIADFVYPNERGEVVVCDLKTGRSRANHALQLGAYALGILQNYGNLGQLAVGAIITAPRWRLNLPQPKLEVELYDLHECMKQVQFLIDNTVKNIITTYESDTDRWQTNTASLYCSEAMCDHYANCHAVQIKTSLEGDSKDE